MFASAVRLGPSDEPPGGSRSGRRVERGANPPEHEDLAYKVELWDAQGEVIKLVLAVTSSASIGYAAYYAATREFPEAVITLRHKNIVMSKWGGKPH